MIQSILRRRDIVRDMLYIGKNNKGRKEGRKLMHPKKGVERIIIDNVICLSIGMVVEVVR